MEGSLPTGAAHIAALQNHPFLMDFSSLPQPTPLRELLAQVRPSSLQALSSTGPLASHRYSGVTTRSTFRRQNRSSTRGAMDGTSSSMSSHSTAATDAAVGTPHETRKRRAACARTGTGTSAKKRRPQVTPKAAGLKKAPPGSEATPDRKIPPAPAGLKKDSDYGEENVQPNCCICMCEPEPADVSTINGCQHKFCFDCIEKWADRENTCPLCKVRFTKIDRVNKPKRRKGEPSRKGSKQVKMRDQRSIPESALEGLVASLSAPGTGFPPHSIARLLFAGMGTSFFEFGPTRLVRAREVHFDTGPRPFMFAPRADFFEDSMMSLDDDDDDDSDDDESFSGFFGHMRRVHNRSFRLAMPNAQRFAAQASASASTQAAVRSYAVNIGESTAGNALNPLEIEDDSDDEVEVVEVMANVE